MSVPRIAIGLELWDDDGDEVVVHKINEERGTVTLLTSDGDRYGMSLRELRIKLRDGAFAQVVDAGTGEDYESDHEGNESADVEDCDDG